MRVEPGDGALRQIERREWLVSTTADGVIAAALRFVNQGAGVIGLGCAESGRRSFCTAQGYSLVSSLARRRRTAYRPNQPTAITANAIPGATRPSTRAQMAPTRYKSPNKIA